MPRINPWPRIDPFTSHAQIYVTSNVDNVADSEKNKAEFRDESNRLPSMRKITSLVQFHAKHDVTSAYFIYYYFRYATRAVSFQLAGRLSVTN